MADDKKKRGVFEQASDLVFLIQLEKVLFEKLEQDCKNVARDLKEQASVIYNFRDFRSKRVL